MANCTNCGGSVAEGQAFCPNCGQPVGAAPAAGAPPAAQAAAPPPPSAATPPPYQPAPPAYNPPPAYGPPPGYPPMGYQPPRKSRMGLWIGLGALIVAIVVACVLVFVVFKDKIFDGGAATGPEKAVQKLLSALENKDADAFFDLVDPASFEQFTGMGMSLDDVKDIFASEIFTYDSMKFNNIKMESEENDDGTVTVRIVEGTVTIVEDGDKTTEDVRDSDEPVVFEVFEQGGKWYINPETMF